MFLLPIKLDRVSFETKGRQNLESNRVYSLLPSCSVFCHLLFPLPLYASAIYVSYIYGHVE